MRSNEIAQIAGVSIRTLRHYHRIGLLPEPPRKSNGYRDYGAAQLIRLLRIVNLTDLGVKLADIAAILDEDNADSSAQLDALESTLDKQIKVLKRRRLALAAIRDGNVPLDLPPVLGRAFIALESGRSQQARTAGREQAVLLTQMINKDRLPDFVRLYERLAEPPLNVTLQELGHRFDSLGPHSADGEIAALADAYIRHLEPWLNDFNTLLHDASGKMVHRLLGIHAIEATGPEQRRMIRIINEHLSSQGKGPRR